MRAWFWALVMALSLQMAGGLPARADTVDSGAAWARCTADAATWTSADDPDAQAIDMPRGTSTEIFACPVAGHLVRMNFASFWQPHYHCGEIEDGTISVWVDGVKVVDRREYDGYAACMDLPEAKQVVYKIIVNRRMHMTVCATRGEADEAKNCDLTDLSRRLPKPNPKVSAVIRRTPPGLNLVKAGAPVCRALDARLQGHMLDDTDPVTAAYGVHSNMDDLADGKPVTYALDIDNDGVPDQLTLGLSGDNEIDLDRLSWRRGGEGADMAIDAQAVAGTDLRGSLVDFVTFVRVDGKTYLYKRDNSVGNALPGQAPDDWEAGVGTSPQPVATRHLLTAGADGRFSEVCAWAPKPRPEEFL